MNLNIDAIMGKVSAYAKSPEGKARMKKHIQEYRENGVNETAAGDKLLTDSTIREAAVKFIEILKKTADGCDLPESVMAHINGLHSGSILKTKNGYEVPLYFSGDLHRDSLENDRREYGGIDNIVALFNNGQHAQNYVYGRWYGHSLTSGDGVLRSGSQGDFAWVKSKKEREGLRFIQRAITDFNAKYGSYYNVTVVAGSDYD